MPRQIIYDQCREVDGEFELLGDHRRHSYEWSDFFEPEPGLWLTRRLLVTSSATMSMPMHGVFVPKVERGKPVMMAGGVPIIDYSKAVFRDYDVSHNEWIASGVIVNDLSVSACCDSEFAAGTTVQDDATKELFAVLADGPADASNLRRLIAPGEHAPERRDPSVTLRPWLFTANVVFVAAVISALAWRRWKRNA